MMVGGQTIAGCLLECAHAARSIVSRTTARLRYTSEGRLSGLRGLCAVDTYGARRALLAINSHDESYNTRTVGSTPISSNTISLVPRVHRKRRSVREIAKDMRAYVFARPVAVHARKGSSDTSSDED